MVDKGDVKPRTRQVSDLIFKYMRPEHLPQIWCAGCGNGIIMRDVAQAIENLGLSRSNTVIVSGIGCSSRAAGYLDFNTIHTIHGRAIAFATGIKLANPHLEVIVIAGDGDISAIGGNHLIHAARRNIGLTVVVMNNNIYGMTGGQYSPTTPTGEFGTTAPYGNIDRAFDIAKLAYGAGASYAARGSAYHVQQTISLIQEGIRHRGFSIIDVASVCPTYYGRKNKKGSAVDMLKWQRDNAVQAEKAKTMTPEELKGKLVLGAVSQSLHPEFTYEYGKLIERLYEEKEQREEQEKADMARIGKVTGQIKNSGEAPVSSPAGRERNELRLAGSGGQGIILASVILAQAAVLAGKYTAQSQSYGPEARGGQCKAETLVSDTPIGFTKVQNPTFLMCLTQESLSHYGKSVGPDCMVLIDSALTPPENLRPEQVVKLPILETARTKVGRLQTANIVAVACINTLIGLTDRSSMEQAVLMHIPKGTESLNLKAFEEGVRLASESLGALKGDGK